MEAVSKGDVVKINEEATKILEALIKLSEVKEGLKRGELLIAGGWLCTRTKASGRKELSIPVGKWILLSEEERNRCASLSEKNCQRLWENLGNWHISSWQSRNPSNNELGGAIVAGDLIVSFSGFSEFSDEAVAVRLAIGLGWINFTRAFEIIFKSKNDLFAPLFDLLNNS